MTVSIDDMLIALEDKPDIAEEPVEEVEHDHMLDGFLRRNTALVYADGRIRFLKDVEAMRWPNGHEEPKASVRLAAARKMRHPNG